MRFKFCVPVMTIERQWDTSCKRLWNPIERLDVPLSVKSLISFGWRVPLGSARDHSSPSQSSIDRCFNDLRLPRWYHTAVSSMRFSMGILKNRHGVHFVRRKVPNGLEEAVAKVLGNGKARRTFLQQSLKTKDGAAAKRKAPAVLMHFDSVLARARVLGHGVRQVLLGAGPGRDPQGC